MFNYLFNPSNYKEKINSISHLRQFSFFIWKLIIGLAFYFMLKVFLNNYYILNYLLFGVRINLNFWTFIFVMLSTIFLDSIKVAVFKNYDDLSAIVEQTIRLLLEPKFQTFFLFFNTTIISLILKKLENESGISNKSNGYSYHIIMYGITNSLMFIYNKENFKWNQIALNRIDSFKYSMRQFANKFLFIICQNSTLFIICNAIEERRFVSAQRLITFLVLTTILELINFLSYQNLKNWLCTPINSNYDDLQKNEDLFLIKFDFQENSRYLNIHYLQNLTLIVETKIKSQSNDVISKEVLTEFKSKINRILDCLNKKSVGKSYKGFLKYFIDNLEFSEIFTNSTSIIIFENLTKLIVDIILLLSKQGGAYESFIFGSDSPTSAKSDLNTQYIIYFFDTLLEIERKIKFLTENNLELRKFIKNNEYLNNEIEFLKRLLKNRITFILKRNLRENFIRTFGKNINEKIKEFVI